MDLGARDIEQVVSDLSIHATDVKELDDLQLAAVGGGIGDISAH